MDAKEACFNFSEFSAKFKENFDDNAINLKELCVTKSVMNAADFYKSLEENLKIEAGQTTPNKKLGTVEEYAELFKVLDTYPSNLQRPIKKRELQRVNSSTLKVNETTIMQESTTAVTVPSNVSLTHRNEDQRTAAMVFNDFKKFKQKLRAVQAEASALEKTQSDYLTAIAQLQNFAEQLEKLMPGEREASDAFTATEEEHLLALAENMKQLNYMRAHSPSKSHVKPRDSAAARLEILVDVLTYTLMQLSGYNSV